MVQAIEQWGGLAVLAALMLIIVLKVMYPQRRRRGRSDGGEGPDVPVWYFSDGTGGDATHHHGGFDGGQNGS